MKLKERFKKAMFEFFRHEILEATKEYSKQYITFETKTLDFVELDASVKIDMLDDFRGMPIGHAYSIAVEKAKRRVISEAMKHVIVDSQSIFESINSPERTIRAALYIGKPRR